MKIGNKYFSIFAILVVIPLILLGTVARNVSESNFVFSPSLSIVPDSERRQTSKLRFKTLHRSAFSRKLDTKFDYFVPEARKLDWKGQKVNFALWKPTLNTKAYGALIRTGGCISIAFQIPCCNTRSRMLFALGAQFSIVCFIFCNVSAILLVSFVIRKLRNAWNDTSL